VGGVENDGDCRTQTMKVAFDGARRDVVTRGTKPLEDCARGDLSWRARQAREDAEQSDDGVLRATRHWASPLRPHSDPCATRSITGRYGKPAVRWGTEGDRDQPANLIGLIANTRFAAPTAGNAGNAATEYVGTPSAESTTEHQSEVVMSTVGGGTETTHRYAYYRAVQLKHVLELRDDTAMNLAPAGAIYYPWRIYYGHSYVRWVRGSSETFTVELGAKFLSAGGGIEAFTKENKLEAGLAGSGLAPSSGQAIFAKNAAEVEGSYVPTGNPVPILVEYRRIPNVAFTDSSIAWVSIPKKRVEIRFSSIQVKSHGSWAYDYSNWTINATCKVNGAIKGEPGQVLARKVSVGSYPLAWSTVIEAQETDSIECYTNGNYTRTTGTPSLSSATTGLVFPSSLKSGPVTGTAAGKDSNTDYAITYSATLLP